MLGASANIGHNHVLLELQPLLRCIARGVAPGCPPERSAVARLALRLPRQH